MKILYILLVITLLSCNRKDEKKSFYYSSQSDTLLLRGEYDEAETAINRAIELDENNYVAYNNLGVLEMHHNRSKEVILHAFLRSISIKPDYQIGLFSLANYFLEIKDYSNSLQYCTRYLEIINNHDELTDNIAHIWAIRGECKNHLGEYESSLDDLRHAIGLNPMDAGAYKELGSSLRNLHKFDEAIKNYSKAIEVRPDYAQAFNGRALCYDDGIKDFEKALSDYSKSIELDSESGTYYFNRGAFLFENNFRDKALPDLQKADSLGKTEAKKYLEKYNK